MALTEFQRKTIWLSMRRMFKLYWHYSICAVDNCLEIAGKQPAYKIAPELHALHCVHFSDMTPEFRKELWFKTLDIIDPELHQWGFWYEVEHRPVPWYTRFLKKLREANSWHKVEEEDPDGKKTANPAQT